MGLDIGLDFHLKESFGPWSPGLEHDGQDGEDDDLDGGATGVPVGAADAILKDGQVRASTTCLNTLTLGKGFHERLWLRCLWRSM